jgi:hypothetical protein
VLDGEIKVSTEEALAKSAEVLQPATA